MESLIIFVRSIFQILFVFHILHKFDLVPHFFAWVSNPVLELVNFDLDVSHGILRIWESVVDQQGGSLLILTLDDGVLVQESHILRHTQRRLELVNLLENVLALAFVGRNDRDFLGLLVDDFFDSLLEILLVGEIAGGVLDHVGFFVFEDLGDMLHIVLFLLHIDMVWINELNLVIGGQIVILVESLILGVHRHFLNDKLRVWHLQEWEEVAMFALGLHLFGVSSSVLSVVVSDVWVAHFVGILDLVLIIARVMGDLAVGIGIWVLHEEFVGAERINRDECDLASLLDVADILNGIAKDLGLTSWSCDVTVLCLRHVLHLPREDLLVDVSFAASLLLFDFIDLGKNVLLCEEVVNVLEVFLALVVSELLGEHDVVSVLAVRFSDFVGWQVLVFMGHAIVLLKFEHVAFPNIEETEVLPVEGRNVLGLVADVQEALVDHKVVLKPHIGLVVELDIFHKVLVRERI